MSKIMDDLLKEVAVLTAIELWQDDGVPESEILNRIMNRYELNRIEAEAYLAKSKVSA
ncbi:MAG: hypothetical protein LUH03_10905 [Oscillospiraceae bacterium]|nr:hypothetical protein [Oscillospiraceae bacterium]